MTREQFNLSKKVGKLFHIFGFASLTSGLLALLLLLVYLGIHYFYEASRPFSMTLHNKIQVVWIISDFFVIGGLFFGFVSLVRKNTPGIIGLMVSMLLVITSCCLILISM